MGIITRESFTREIEDTAEHTVPDNTNDGKVGVKGTGSPTAVTLVRVTNTHDQEATVRLEGALHDDATFSNPVNDVENVPVAASTGVEVLTTTLPWALVRVVISYAVAPTPNSGTVEVAFERHG